MFEKLESESEICNEIVFFMHNCLTCDSRDLTNIDTLICAKVICKNMVRLTATQFAQNQPLDQNQVYLIKRTLLAIESTTRSNRNLLSEMASEYHLHNCLVTLLHRLNAEKDSESVCLSIKLIIRLLRRKTDAEFDFFQLQFGGIFAALATILS